MINSPSKRDLLWSYSAQVFQYGANVFILPVVLHLLPADQLGIWYVFASISGLVQLLDFGFQPTISRNVTYVFSGARELRKEGVPSEVANASIDYNLLANLVRSCKQLYKWIALGASVILLFFGTAYIRSISPQWNSMVSLQIAWLIYVLSFVVNIYFVYLSPMLIGRGLIKESYKATTYSKVAYIILCFVGLKIGLGLVALSSAYLISVITNRVVSGKFFYDTEIRTCLLYTSPSPRD